MDAKDFIELLNETLLKANRNRLVSYGGGLSYEGINNPVKLSICFDGKNIFTIYVKDIKKNE